MDLSYTSSRSGYVYLVWAISTPRYKLGKSLNPPLRLEQLNAQSCYPLRLLESHFFENYVYHEKRLHSVAAQWRVHGEWFEIPEFVLQNTMLWFHNPKCTRIEKLEHKRRVLVYEKKARKDKIVSVSLAAQQRALIFQGLTINQPEKIPRAIELLGHLSKNINVGAGRLQELREILGQIPNCGSAATNWKCQLKQILKETLSLD